MKEAIEFYQWMMKNDTPENCDRFVNHSDEPNCIKIKEGDRYSLFTLRDIKAEEEITYMLKVKATILNLI